MIKKFISLCTLFLIIVGALNVITINQEVLRDVTEVMSEKPLKEIPRDVLTTITAHHWKIIK